MHIPYSGYPLWRLREWKEKAEKAGDSNFVRICEDAIVFKGAAEQVAGADAAGEALQNCKGGNDES